MNKYFKIFIVHLLISIVVIGYWKFNTLTSNYAWFPKGKDLLFLDLSLLNIFIFKSIFWLIVTNGLTIGFSYYQITGQKSILPMTITLIFVSVFLRDYVNEKCAGSYLQVFYSQSVTEEFINRPLKDGGKETLKIATADINRKDLKLRSYIIKEIGNSNYTDATENLVKILIDSTEKNEIRAESYSSLSKFATKDSKFALKEFEKSTTNKTKEIIRLGKYFNNEH